MRSMSVLLVVLLFASSATAADELQLSITTVDGKQLAGNLTAWDSHGLTIEVAGEPIKIEAERLLAVRRTTADTPEQKLSEEITSRLELIDGTILLLSDYSVSNHQSSVNSPLVEHTINVPTSKIRLLEYAPFDPRVAELWNSLSDKSLDGDVLIVHKKKRTTLDYLTRVIGEVTKDQVIFNFEGDEIPVKASKVAALGYFHARQSESSDAVCWLKTLNGDLLPAASLSLNQETLEVTTIEGLEISLPIALLQQADYSMGKVAYLSDLQPIHQQWTPRIGFSQATKLINNHGAPRRDQSFSGSTLALQWPIAADSSKRSKTKHDVKLYQKGLALRSHTVLQYRLPKQMQRFITIAGIDPATTDQGNVLLSISADDHVVWEGEIDGSSAPVEIECVLNGARQLRIEVDYGSNLDYGDRLHLVEARVSK